MAKSASKRVVAAVTLEIGPPGESRTVRPGEDTELPKDEAERLIRLGHAHEPGRAPRPATGAPRKPAGEALTQAISEAILTLDPENEDAWTGGGKPSVHALSAVLGYEVTAAERDAAWAAVARQGDG